MRPPTQAQVRKALSYDPETGLFVWKIKPAKNRESGGIAGGISSNGYWRISVYGVRRTAHRIAWLYVHGEWPKQDIDHINGVRTDNRIDNLRVVSRSINLQNQRTAKSHNKSTGILGAYPAGNRFTSRIQVFGQDIYLGCFETAQQAHMAYIKAKRKYHKGNQL